MSALASRLPGEATNCHHCGARIAAGQDWCLECGTAVNVRIRPAPDWRIPVAIVGGVVVLVVIVLVLTLNAASNSAKSSVPAVLSAPPAVVHHHRATRAASTTGVPSAGPRVGSWPSGVTGYTVVLAVIHDKAAATAQAKKIALTGVPVGLLFSTDYSSMRPGDWIVFSGTYTSRAEADTAAAALKSRGQPGAYSFSVVPAAGAGTATTGAGTGTATTPGATTPGATTPGATTP